MPISFSPLRKWLRAPSPPPPWEYPPIALSLEQAAALNVDLRLDERLPSEGRPRTQRHASMVLEERAFGGGDFSILICRRLEKWSGGLEAWTLSSGGTSLRHALCG